MNDPYEPAADDVLRGDGWSERAVEHYLREARRAAKRAPLQLAVNFKIGRCQKKDFPRLRARPMYRNVELIVPLVECPRRVARTVEELLTHRYREAAAYWGDGTLTNRKIGGGPLGHAPVHVVYLVITETLVRVGNELVFRWDLATRVGGASNTSR